MAKKIGKKTTKRTKKTQEKKDSVRFLKLVYGSIVIFLSVIGLFQIGIVGEFLSSIFVYLFGQLEQVFFLLSIIFSIFYLLKKNLKDIPFFYRMSFVLLLFAAFFGLAAYHYKGTVGMDVFQTYFTQSKEIFKGIIYSPSGIIGALLYALSSLLFGSLGTWILVGGLTIMAIIVMLPFEKLKKKSADMKEKRSQRKEERELQAEKEAIQQEEDELYSVPFYDVEDLELEGMSDSIDKRVHPGQVHFIDSDEDHQTDEIYSDDIGFSDAPIGIQADNDEIEEVSKDEDVQVVTNKKSSATTSKIVNQDYSKYKLPRLNLLKDPVRTIKSVENKKSANEAGRRLIEILDQFGVKATLVATHIGPSVTKFEVKPDMGVRVNKISNLQSDIKMALAAKELRIEAPIPGKSAVGIEIPNVEKSMVYMKELMRNIPEKYEHSKTLFALGKDLMGNSVYGELNKMPHLLIAGATGSGKSVCVNSIITSILMRTKPDEVKLLLIDPKKVEFTQYKEVPHLISEVITDAASANLALKMIVEIMDNRYEKFSSVGVRNIAGYNKYIDEHPEENNSREPMIVVIIDELADLMLVAAKEVEASIQRITQLARAAGIHLIVATQRPSVDVITGVIKANIPSRIAFAVSSNIDSRTILDQQGAEKLLGYGDMLYIPVGETVATRVQGVFVSDEEVNAVASFVSAQALPAYYDSFVTMKDPSSVQLDSNGEPSDNLYESVKEYVIQAQKASTSLIQRKFSVGYARAARLIDTLEDNGVVGPAKGSKPREVYAKPIDDEEEM